MTVPPPKRADPHAHHPAIRRGHYEVQTLTVARADTSDPSGDVTLHVVGRMPTLLRVVVAGLDLRAYLPDVEDGPRDLTSDEFVQLVAPYLREGLIDPGNGRKNRGLPPVITMETEAGLAFVQAVACLN